MPADMNHPSTFSSFTRMTSMFPQAALCAIALLSLNVPALAADAERPNVVFIILDDLGPADLGCYGSKCIRTPNIDRLAREGIRFTREYAGCSVCAPTRSTLMTGRHMGHTTVRANPGGVPLRDEDVTIAEVLKKAGYATGGFGKWGLGDLDTSGVPERQGFDRFFGYYHQVHAHYFFPEYLIDELQAKSGASGKPVKVLIMEALRQSGYHVEDIDMRDQRKKRGR